MQSVKNKGEKSVNLYINKLENNEAVQNYVTV